MLGVHCGERPGRELLPTGFPAKLFDGVGDGAAFGQGERKFFTAEEFGVAAEKVNAEGE